MYIHKVKLYAGGHFRWLQVEIVSELLIQVLVTTSFVIMLNELPPLNSITGRSQDTVHSKDM